MTTKQITAKLDKLAESELHSIDYWGGNHIRLNGGNLYVYRGWNELPEPPYYPVKGSPYRAINKNKKIREAIEQAEKDIDSARLKLATYINLKLMGLANLINDYYDNKTNNK